MADFLRCGMSMRTPKGSVDLVPLFRRLEGDKDTPVLDDERTAAVLALAHLGTPVVHIHRALNMDTSDVKAVLAEHGMEPVYLSEPEAISWSRVAYNSVSSTERRERRAADRVIVDGLLVHPDAPHGTNTGYTEYRCQCGPCGAAHAVKLAEHRAEKKMARAA